jgi:acetate kinase
VAGLTPAVMRVLVFNAGSSTLKASLVTPGSDDAVSVSEEWPPGDDLATAPAIVRRVLDQLPPPRDAVGYRIVHGGMRYRAAAPIDDELLESVSRLDALAPLHNRRAAAVARAGRSLIPDVPHVACFDTAFHAGLPDTASLYALPSEWVERWQIRRFGFHGLSVAWSTRRAAEVLGRPVEELGLIVAHLGSGCSVTAVESARSVATSMGFTPFEGPMMGTRSGSVDPGILIFLLRQGVSTENLAEGLFHRSGLLAVAGTADVRELERLADDGDEAANLAVGMFTHQVAAAIGAAGTALRSIDAIIFTGGVGEHSSTIRSGIVARLGALSAPGTAKDGTTTDGRPAILTISAREDLIIADEVSALLGRLTTR